MEQQKATESVNVGVLERLACTAAGSILVTRSLTKPTFGRLLGAAAGADLMYRGITGHCALYQTLGLNTAAQQRNGSDMAASAPEVTRSITIGKSPEELFAFWRDPQKLALIVSHFAQVTPLDHGITHWRLREPLSQVVEWDSRNIETPPSSIAWESLPGSKLVNHGNITFRPGPDSVGTEVTLHMQFDPPLGSVGAAIVSALHKIPRGVAGQTLRRFKSLVETGEIPSLALNPSGRGNSDSI